MMLTLHRECTLIHTYVHTYIRTYIRTYIHTYICTYVHTYTHTHIHTYIHTYIYTYIHTYNNMHTLTLTVSSSLTECHVIEHILHGPTMWERTGSVVSSHILLLSSLLTLLCVEKQHQLLLDLFALLWIRRPPRGLLLKLSSYPKLESC